MVDSDNNDVTTTGDSGLADKDADELILSYLTCLPYHKRSTDVLVGALLITDARTRPLHFAYVEPIRPTVLQRMLYGDDLHIHVMTDVIPKKLFDYNHDVRPTVVFVNSPEILSARNVVGIPMAHISRNDGDGACSESHISYRFDTGVRDDDYLFFRRLFSPSEQHVDLLDPFSRMILALKEVLKGEQA